MNDEVIDWLRSQVGPLRPGQRLLLLCRTRATVSLVRRWAARTGGLLGVEAVTPQGLAVQVRQAPVLRGPSPPPRSPEPDVPATTVVGARIGARPGLASIARRWVQHLRVSERARPGLRAPAWLEELARHDQGQWGLDDEEAARHELLDVARERGRNLTASASWDRVVALGFDAPQGFVSAWESAIVEALTGVAPSSAALSDPLVPMVSVPDVAAETRATVHLARADPHGTLVLVSDVATARRLRDALRREGLGAAWRDPEPLSIHELAGAVRRAAPWFLAGPDPAIQVADLGFVLSQGGLARRLHPAAEAWMQQRAGALALPPEMLHLSKSGVVDALTRARLLDAPLSRWISRMQELAVASEEQAEQRASARAIAVWVRLLVLQTTIQGTVLEDALADADGSGLAFDADDFDDVLATLLGEAGPAAPNTDTLGAVLRFLVACRVRVHDDPVALAVLGSLKRRGDWRATPSAVHQTLAGAHDPGVLIDGVDVMMVDDYDGRPSRQLVVLDAHDHGLTRRPTPDPLLTDDEIGALGALSGRAWVDARLSQLRRAIAASSAATVLVTRRDASGREVVAPIQLKAREAQLTAREAQLTAREAQPTAREAPLGAREAPLGAREAQLGAREAQLGARETPLGAREAQPALPADAPRPPVLEVAYGAAEPPVHADPVVRLLALQASVEWVRAGRGHRGVSFDESGRALSETLAAERPIAPSHLVPWLGHAEGVPEALLPAGPHSATGTFGPITRCLYQAFARRVLGLREPVTLVQDLDPRELGNTVHLALEAVGADLVPRRLTDEVQQEKALRALRSATTQAFDDAVAALGALSPARRASAEGRRDRLLAHWPSWVASRSARPKKMPDAWDFLTHHPQLRLAIDALRRRIPALGPVTDHTLRKWLEWFADLPGRAEGPLAGLAERVVLQVGTNAELPPSALPDLPGAVEEADVRAFVRTVAALLMRRNAWMAEPFATVAELPFGPDQDQAPARLGLDLEGATLALGPTVLTLGARDIELRGAIDRVDWVRGDREIALIVTDYKTGRKSEGWQFRRDVYALRDPQLLLYAMVAERACRTESVPEALRGAQAAVIAHDRVMHALDGAEAGEREPQAPSTWTPIDRPLLVWAARELGALLDSARAGRWTLRPRSDSCPAVATFGTLPCPAHGACRLRALPGRSAASEGGE